MATADGPSGQSAAQRSVGDEREEAELAAGVDALTQAAGKTETYPHGAFSPDGVAYAAAFRPRPSDVFILTPPKTGTTWMQMLCHALRTRGEHVAFEDIYQVSPWDQMAWDLGQSLEDEQVASPRLYKTHQRLSAINRGARYLCMVRRPEDVLLSWWHFLRARDPPPLRKYSSASEFAFDDDFFAKGMRFGATIWEYYVEFFRARRLPSVLVLCYEDMVEDLQGHIPLLARFLGLQGEQLEALKDPAALSRILHLASRDGMREMESKFDESWTFEELKRVGRMRDPSTFAPSSRVNAKPPTQPLSDAALQFLRSRWEEQVASETGLADYAALRQALRDEVQARMEPTD